MSLKHFVFVEEDPRQPGGVLRFTEWAPSYGDATERMVQRGFEIGPCFPNGDTAVVRGAFVKDEDKLESAASDRDARKVKKLQRQQSAGS